MKRLSIVFISVIIAFTCGFAETRILPIGDYSLPYNIEGKKSVLIQKGDDPSFASTNLDDTDWQIISLPNNWLKTVYTNYSGIVWYRIHFRFPSELPPKAIAVNLGIISDKDITYFNGELIGKKGDFNNPLDHAYTLTRIYEIPTTLIRPGADNVIAIRVTNHFPKEGGPWKGDFEIDYLDKLKSNFYLRDMLKILFLAIYLVISGYYFLFFFKRTQDKEYLFFALFTLFYAIMHFMRLDLRMELFSNFLILKKIEYIAYFVMMPLFMEFIIQNFKEKRKWFHYVLYGIAVIGVIVVLITKQPVIWDFINTKIVQFSWLIVVASVLYILFKKFKRNTDARLMVYASIVIVFTAVLDILIIRGIINTAFLQRIGMFTNYSVVFFIVSIALILANRFVKLRNQVEDLNKNLEQKVKERTKEVFDLIEQQHGDYFLTSLLINPLMTNSVNSNTIGIEFYLEQKKKFKFRHWEADLGGDMCMAHTMMLQGKKYTVFCNSDAMGKSMQGAGGALVIGVVFNSIVERTQTLRKEQERTPIEWLQECYNQLEKIFETFDGSMLVSGIIGIIDDESGEMSYFNAEHPSLVLYRDGRAMFARDEENMARKIGTVGFAGVDIEVVQLQAGDIIISGSDGRDDILLGTNKQTGQRIINEDETLFLKIVEKNEAKIDEIVKSLVDSGELTDDLSLIRITFKDGSIPKQKKLDFSIDAITDDGRISIDYHKSIDKQEQNTNKFEKMNDDKKEASLFYKDGNYNGTIIILERLKGEYNRASDKFQVLYLLGHSYIKVGKFLLALSVWKDALKLDPVNDKLKENIEKLEVFIAKLNK